MPYSIFSSRALVLDSDTLGAFDHIFGTPHLLAHFTNAIYLSLVTLANGAKIAVKSVGCANPLPSLPLDSVLYILNCPFNLVSISKLMLSLNCFITFDNKFVVI